MDAATEIRMRNLETRLRWTTIVALVSIGLCPLLIAGTAIAWRRAERARYVADLTSRVIAFTVSGDGTVTAPRFLLKDASGRTRGEWRTADPASTSLTLSGPDGRTMAALESGGRSSGIYLYGGGKLPVAVVTAKDEWASVSIGSVMEGPFAELGLGPLVRGTPDEPYLEFSNVSAAGVQSVRWNRSETPARFTRTAAPAGR